MQYFVDIYKSYGLAMANYKVITENIVIVEADNLILKIT